jgi:RNA polymerase sigma factor (TIGR02999 family)
MTLQDSPSQNVSQLLRDWSNGNDSALQHLMPLIDQELRLLAHRFMRRENPGHTLQTTALVNEAYLRLVGQRVEWKNRSHFFGIAASLMRRILVDHARAQLKIKRGGGAHHVALDEALTIANERGDDLIALDEALNKLTGFDQRKSKVVELRFFGGLSVEETAEVLEVSPVTVMREWSMAKAWLHRELSNDS